MVKQAWLDGVRKQTWNTNGGSFISGPPKCVLHSTETTGWPGYDEGKKAPHITGMADVFNKRMMWRQHIPLNVAARAMRNESGGVQTNRDSAVQVELIGTTDPSYVYRSRTIYWPEAPDWALDQVGEMIARLADNNGFQLVVPQRWVPYPKSYGKNATQRMSFTEWDKFNGVCAHQHVPENSHGDVYLDIVRVIRSARQHLTLLNPSPIVPSGKKGINMFVGINGRSKGRLVTGDRIVGIPVSDVLALKEAGVPYIPLSDELLATLQGSLTPENC